MLETHAHVAEKNFLLISHWWVYRSVIEEIPKSCNAQRYGGRGTQGLNIVPMPWDIVIQVHLNILNNFYEVQPYLSTHKGLIKEKYL